MPEIGELTDGRLDVALGNDSTAFLITSRDIAGCDTDGIFGDTARWEAAVVDGAFIPIELLQDDPVNVRVVMGGLTDDERAECLARLTTRLRVPSGELLLAAGTEILDGEELDEYLRYVRVPAGEYVATVYTLVHSINAIRVLEGQLGGGDDTTWEPPLGAWWRRTRADEPIPEWLQFGIGDGAYSDPGHEPDDDDGDDRGDDFYERTEALAEQAVHFILQLEPLTGDPPPLPAWASEGWFAFGERTLPAACPRGLHSDAMWDPDTADQGPRSRPAAVDVASAVAGKTPVELDAPVMLPLRETSHLFQIAFFCNDSIGAELHVRPPVGAPFDTGKPMGTVVTQTGRDVRIAFEETGGRLTLWRWLTSMMVDLEVPDGAQLELMTALVNDDPDESDDPDDDMAPPDAGTFRFVGTVDGGILTLSAVWPQLDAATLCEMLELTGAAAAERRIPCTDAEAETVIARCERDSVLDDITVRYIDGELALKPRRQFSQVALHLFQVRYADQLPIVDDDTFNQQMGEAFGQLGAKLVAAFSRPTTGRVILEGGSGRFMEPDPAALVTGDVDDSVDTDLAALGFRPLGSMLSERFGDLLITGWADGDCYATVVRNPLGGEARECYTAFADGTSLTTSTGSEPENPTVGYFRQDVHGPFRNVVNAHRRAVAGRVAAGAKPLPAPPTLEGLAEAVDAFILRVFG